MSLYASINRSPKRRELIEFGLVVAIGFAIIAAVLFLRSHRTAAPLGLLAAGLATLALSTVPRVGRPLYVAWMALGLTLGAVTAPIFMGVLFVVVFVPAAAVLRLVRPDPLRRQVDRGAQSYWEEYPRTDDPGRYTRQF